MLQEPAMSRTIEKYEVLEELGHGGMATVFRARDTKLDRLVALKLLHPHLRGAAEARARFRREAQSVAKLHHPRILEIYDYSGEGSDESYIAAELLTGPTLKVYVEQADELPAEIAACFAIEIARALVAAHEKGIIHRDVKPENILLHENRVLKLTDFGIAAMVDSHSMTATGQILGSPGHMAPEQIEGHDTDARTDVFALGTVLYFLATGRLPFTGKNPHHVLKRVLDGDVTDPLRFRASMGAALKAITLKAMATKPDERYASVAEFEAALRVFVALIGIEDPEDAVTRFLVDPNGTSKDVQARVIAHYTQRGKDLVAKENSREAMDAFDRVLALDEKNEEVLTAVAGMGRSKHRSRRVKHALIAAGTLGTASLAAWSLTHLGGSEATHPHVPETHDAGAPSDAFIAYDVVAPRDAVDAPQADIPPEPVIAFRPVHPVLTVPRRVVFDFDPQNVQIAVDNQPLRLYGPAFSYVDLLPGRHRFHIVSNVDCCSEATIERVIEPGEGAMPLRHVLPSRPAILIVRTNTPADVVVEPGLARGRAQGAIDVPITARERVERRTITVTAPGFAAYTGEVQFAAGGVTTTQVTLSALPSGAPE
jgi:serine/threonine-protein kinase